LIFFFFFHIIFHISNIYMKVVERRRQNDKACKVLFLKYTHVTYQWCRNHVRKSKKKKKIYINEYLFIWKSKKDPKIQIINDNNRIHMKHINIHYGFSIKDVAALHTEILKNRELHNFYILFVYLLIYLFIYLFINYIFIFF